MNLITLTGPTCSGKTHFQAMLLRVYPEKFCSAVSHTTRDKRPGEVDGVDYHFVSKEHFMQMVSQNEFLEHVQFNGVRYGVSRATIEAAAAKGKTAVLIVEPNGLKQIVDYCNNSGWNLLPVYFGGEFENLLTRYFNRSQDEISLNPTNPYHVKRIISLSNEIRAWPGLFTAYCTSKIDQYNAIQTMFIYDSCSPETQASILSDVYDEAKKFK